MKKTCEIYDLSKEYNTPTNSVFVIVSDFESDKLVQIIPELKKYSNKIMKTEDWYDYLEINAIYNRNDNKFFMREVRQSQKSELSSTAYIDDIHSILDNDELKEQINYALSFLKEQPKRRFLKHYLEQHTYRQIATEENKNVKSIYCSIQSAKKKFIKYFSEYPQQNTPNKCK